MILTYKEHLINTTSEYPNAVPQSINAKSVAFNFSATRWITLGARKLPFHKNSGDVVTASF